MKQKTRILIIVLCFALFCPLFNIHQEVCASTSSAKSMVVIEADSKRILYEKNCNERLAMASTTKIATAFTVLNHCKDIDKRVKISDLAVGIEGTSMYLKKGEELTIRELLYGMMLPSGNDASMALAIAVGGSKEKFVMMMNNDAKAIGACETNFMNPHGLDEKGHYTTAYDLALITAKAMSNDIFREIVSTKSTKVTGSSPETFRYLRNKNKLLHTNEFCDGVKTGFTDNAGRCFVSSAEKDGMRVVSVVLNCGPMFEECNALMTKAFEEYKMVSLLEPYKYHKKIQVQDGKLNDVKVFTRGGFKYPLKTEEMSKLTFSFDLPNVLVAPVEKEQEVGELKIYFDKHLLFSEKIYTMEEVKELGLLQNLRDIISQW